MNLSEFRIGLEFWMGGARWRCTDVGRRVVIAIKLDHAENESWYNGPPYAVAEFVIDEYDLPNCEPVSPDKSVSGCCVNADVAAAGGWRDTRALKTSDQQTPDGAERRRALRGLFRSHGLRPSRVAPTALMALILVSSPAIMNAQRTPDEFGLDQVGLAKAALHAVRLEQFPNVSDHPIALAVVENGAKFEATSALGTQLAQQLGADQVRLKDVTVCETIRRCELPDDRLYMSASVPHIRGDTANIWVKVWQNQKMSEYTYMSSHQFIVTARRSNGGWVVINQELVGIT